MKFVVGSSFQGNQNLRGIKNARKKSFDSLLEEKVRIYSNGEG